jgi:hypothetical protein
MRRSAPRRAFFVNSPSVVKRFAIVASSSDGVDAATFGSGMRSSSRRARKAPFFLSPRHQNLWVNQEGSGRFPSV